MDIKAILKKQEKYMWGQMNLYKRPVAFSRGEGVHVWDTEGREYLDMFGGMLTLSTGHCHPRVVEAVKKQVETLIFEPSLYPHENSVIYSEKLAAIAPKGLLKSYYGLSGTEAVENAIKLAVQYTGKTEIIALRGAYHGLSTLGMNLTAFPGWRGRTQVPGIKHAIQPNCYRCAMHLSYPSCNIACARDIEEIILKTTSGKIAAFIAEPIAGVSGLIVPPPEYFKVAVDIVHKYGGLFIADEVQTMFGRSGTHWYGAKHWGVLPDIMTCGKSMASGMPISVTVTRPDIADALDINVISTFQQHPVSMAAAIATLEVLQEEAPPSHVEEMGTLIRKGFEDLQAKYDIIGHLYGRGCMQGMELVKNRETKERADDEMAQLFEETRKNGLLIGKGGLTNAFRFTPPLVVRKEHVSEAIEKLDSSFTAVMKKFKRK
jgi:alanine-glyoxylate transaminase/(R)-3-amino-2-methylpropionate-pyruvate transaminase